MDLGHLISLFLSLSKGNNRLLQYALKYPGIEILQGEHLFHVRVCVLTCRQVHGVGGWG